MTIPQTNFNPPFNITRASHLAFTARDLAASRDFYVEVMGLIVSDENADTIWLRGVEERCHHSLTLKRTSGQPQCERVGFRVFTDEDLDKAKAHFDRTGIAAAFVEVPHQGRTLHFSDPAGTPVELCATMPTVPRMHTKIHMHRGAGALRMDHYQVLVPDVLSTAKFYMELGFRISDYICIEGSEQVVGTFLHRKNNPWDIVLLTRSGPRFHHGGYVVEAFEDIVRACDVAGNLGFARSHRARPRPPRPPAFLLSLRARSRRASHRAPPAGHPDHRHRRRAGALRGQPEGELEPVGAAGAAHLGQRGDQFRRRRDHAPAGRGRADDGGEVPGGADARGGGELARPRSSLARP